MVFCEEQWEEMGGRSREGKEKKGGEYGSNQTGQILPHDLETFHFNLAIS